MPAHNLKEKCKKIVPHVYLAVEYMHNKSVEECLAVLLHFSYQKAKCIIQMLRPKIEQPAEESETGFEPEA